MTRHECLHGAQSQRGNRAEQRIAQRRAEAAQIPRHRSRRDGTPDTECGNRSDWERDQEADHRSLERHVFTLMPLSQSDDRSRQMPRPAIRRP